MNKKYYFALVATAALFASCSSDDVVSGNSPALAGINDGDDARIEIGVNNPGITRGTGTVGDTDPLLNQWAGQTFNLFMFEKGTFTPAQKAVDDGNGGTTNVDIYNNAEMITPVGTGAATYVIGTEEQFNYYPTTGAYSFWAYRVDDAGTGTGGVGEPVGVNDGNATEVKVPFTIDGSQDILTAIPDEAGDLTALQAAHSTATADQIYSAFSSRRGITPTLSFKHQLTRLTFQVKAASREVSDAADLVSADPGVYKGFKVTSISVKSKANGNIIAAWKDGSTYNAQSVVFDDANEDWADPTTLTAMQLKSRGEGVNTKQAGDWSSALTVNISDAGVPTYGTPYTLHGSNFATAAATAVYTTNTEDSYTGVPNGTLTTLGELVAAYVAANPGVAGSISGYAYFKTADLVLDGTPNAAAKLVPLVEVTPAWTGYTPGTAEVPYVKTADAGSDAATYTAADAAKKQDFSGSADVAADLDAWCKTLAVGTGYIYTDGTNYYTFDITTAYAAAVSATGGSATPTTVGEALLVAPMAQSYEMTVTYKRWKKTSTTQYSEIEGTVTKSIARNTASALFEAGKSYNVVITLYKDGDASTNTNLNPWVPTTDGDIDIEGED